MPASAVTAGAPAGPAARPVTGSGGATRRNRSSDLTLPGSAPGAVRTARRHAHDVLGAWGLPAEDVDSATLVVSELVANAEQHTAGPVAVRLTLRRGSELLVAVRDTSPVLPRQAPGARPDQESGRGLEIVDALATRHGYALAGDHKTAWAALPVRLRAARCPHAGEDRRPAPVHRLRPAAYAFVAVLSRLLGARR